MYITSLSWERNHVNHENVTIAMIWYVLHKTNGNDTKALPTSIIHKQTSKTTQTRFMRPMWVPPGSCWPQEPSYQGTSVISRYAHAFPVSAVYIICVIPLTNPCQLMSSVNIPSRNGIIDNLLSSSPNWNWITPKLTCFSSGLAVVFAQSIEVRYEVENKDVVGAAPTGDAPTKSEWLKIVLP